MTTETNDAPPKASPTAAAEAATGQAAADTAAHKEAVNYWGYLIKQDKCGTDMLDRLLKGIAEVISNHFEPNSDCLDLRPSQLAAFYRAVGGNYDVLFVETLPSSISFIYRSLGCHHSLQPTPEDDGYSAPTVPALKHKGFVLWQTIQLLLGPEEHVPFLQNAVRHFDVVDPQTGEVFPKLLPNECFPDRPDDAMEAWYEGVAERLRKEAEEDASEKDNVAHVHIEVDDHGPRTSNEWSNGEGSADERHGAAKYFEDPLYRKHRTRPSFIRRFSKPRSYVEDSRMRMANSVKHIWNPFRDRRRSMPSRYEDDGYSDHDQTPMATVPPPQPRYSHKRPHPPRRGDSLSSTDSDSDSDGPPPGHRPPINVIRHRRSHDPPMSPREYFPSAPPFHDDPRRYGPVPPGPENRKEDGPPPLYGPTKSPLFATHVAQMQAHNYYDRRPSMPPRGHGSYRPVNPAVSYRVQAPSPRDADSPYLRDPYEASSSRVPRDKDRERDRRRSEEHPRVDSRDRADPARTRSHERVRDEWDSRRSPGSRDRSDRSERDRDRERDRERDRDRDRDSRGRTHRYVAGMDGVGGRRYAVEQPWRT